MRVLFYCRGVEQLGVGYMMSYLREQGHEVELLFDPGFDNNFYYKLDFLSVFNRWDKLMAKARAWRPDLAAFSAITWASCSRSPA